MAILDRQVRKLRSKEIPMVKVVWRNHTNKEATWKLEEEMQVRYPTCFKNESKKIEVTQIDRVSKVKIPS